MILEDSSHNQRNVQEQRLYYTIYVVENIIDNYLEWSSTPQHMQE